MPETQKTSSNVHLDEARSSKVKGVLTADGLERVFDHILSSMQGDAISKDKLSAIFSRVVCNIRKGDIKRTECRSELVNAYHQLQKQVEDCND